MSDFMGKDMADVIDVVPSNFMGKGMSNIQCKDIVNVMDIVFSTLMGMYRANVMLNFAKKP